MIKPYHYANGGRVCVIPARRGWQLWKHYLGNDQYGLVATDAGTGYAISPAIEGRLINAFDARRPEVPGRCVYVKNLTSGRLWNICRIPGMDVATTHTRFGQGWYDITGQCEGVRASLRVVVPEDPIAAEVWEVCLSNRADSPVDVAFYPYIEFFLGGNLSINDEPEWYSRGEYLPDENLAAVTLHIPDRDRDETVGAFMAPLYDISGSCLSRSRFVGEGDMSRPQGLQDERLVVCQECHGERIVGVVERCVHLEGGESQRFNLVIGRADSPSVRREILEALSSPGALVKVNAQVEGYWQGVNTRTVLNTPEPRFDRWANIWLKYQQVQSVRMGGGLSANSPLLGYRDMLQHAAGAALIDPAYTRSVIFEALRYQYSNGRAVRQWSRGGKHDERDYRDSPYWIIPALTAYIKETGDLDFLQETAPYLDRGEDTVLGHMEKALDTLFQDRGEHGLSHIGGGDWLDPLNAAGREGRGESVWLTMALLHGLKEAARLYAHIKMDERSRTCLERAGTLEKAIERHAWDGHWYIRLYDDSGRPIGGYEDGRIFLNPQVWSVLSGCGGKDRLDAIFDEVEHRLATPFGYHLFMPPYDKFDPLLGNVSILQFHSVYSHAGAFKIHADCMRGNGDEAMETFGRICPDNPENDCMKSNAEPHIIPNGYFGEGHADMGKVVYSGFSGTFSWMLRGAIEMICGARADYAGLKLSPCLPKKWGACGVVRHIRGSQFDIRIEDPGHLGSGEVSITVDGKHIAGDTIPYPPSPGKFDVVCRIVSSTCGQ